MSRELYERCPVCAGTGRVAVGQCRGGRRAHRCDAAGLTECIACGGERYIKVGLTVEQVEAMARVRTDWLAAREVM